jgi:hypothetical protein
MITVRISEDALQDLNDGFIFYEAQQPGLGDYFVSCLRADIEGLRVGARIHRVVYQDYHRLLSRVFPFGIFYTMEDHTFLLRCNARMIDPPTTKSMPVPDSGTAVGENAISSKPNPPLLYPVNANSTVRPAYPETSAVATRG